MRAIFSVVLTSIILLAVPANAQSKKELAAQDAILAQRLSVLESRLLTGDPAAERLMQRMDGLESALRTARGEIETLRFERDSLRGDLAALSEDLREIQDYSNRMKIHLDAVDLVAQETQGRTARSGASIPVYEGSNNSRTYGGDTGTYQSGDTILSQPSPIPGPPSLSTQTIGVQQDYNDLADLPDTGKRKLAEGDFTGAQQAFRQYLDINGDAPNAGEVQFWLGESYYVKGGYTDAADAYIASMRQDPKGIVAPNAMVKLAATLRELGNVTESCQALSSFPVQYPNAPQEVRDQATIERARSGC